MEETLTYTALSDASKTTRPELNGLPNPRLVGFAPPLRVCLIVTFPIWPLPFVGMFSTSLDTRTPIFERVGGLRTGFVTTLDDDERDDVLLAFLSACEVRFDWEDFKGLGRGGFRKNLEPLEGFDVGSGCLGVGFWFDLPKPRNFSILDFWGLSGRGKDFTY